MSSDIDPNQRQVSTTHKLKTRIVQWKYVDFQEPKKTWLFHFDFGHTTC